MSVVLEDWALLLILVMGIVAFVIFAIFSFDCDWQYED